MGMNAHATVAAVAADLELAGEAGVRRRRRPLTRRISLRLFVVAGVGVAASALCIVMYRASLDALPWKYLAILFGLPSALLAYIACFVRAMDEVR